jgi:hypothetical protein
MRQRILIHAVFLRGFELEMRGVAPLVGIDCTQDALGQAVRSLAVRKTAQGDGEIARAANAQRQAETSPAA